MVEESQSRIPTSSSVEASTVEADVNELLERIQRKEIAVFCGAGISRNSGIPIVPDIESFVLECLAAPAEELGLLLGSSLPFEAFMEALDSCRSIADLLGIFSDGEPNDNHHLIAQLVKSDLLRTIDTTNFDQLIERALEAAGLQEGQRFSRHVDRNHFKGIDWSPGSVRVIKLHGSMERPEEIAVTLRQVAGKVWTEGTQSVIERTFSTGDHEAVLILGYSCSDLFDLSPQIESLNGPQKRVLLVDHETGTPSSEDLAARTWKNPFRRWKNGRRLRVNTDWLVSRIRETCLPTASARGENPPAPNWRAIVEAWSPDLTTTAGKAEAEYLLGTVLTRISSFGLARAHFERGLEQAGDDKLRASCHIGIAVTGEQLADFDALSSHANAAIDLGTKIADANLLRTAKMALGVALLHRSEFQAAEPLIRAAAPDEKEALSNPGLAISALNNLGLLRFGLGQFDDAMSTFVTAANMSAGLGDKREEGNTWTNIGNINSTRGDSRAALRAHQRALEIYRSIGDRWGEIAALNHVGIALKNLGDYGAAFEGYNESLNLAERMGDSRGMMFAHASLALARHDQGLIQDALQHADRALALSDQVDDPKAKAGLYLNLAQVYIGLGELQRAEETMQRGLEIARRIGDVAMLTNFLGFQGSLFSARGDLAKAHELYAEVFERAERAGLRKTMASSMLSIGNTLGELGQLEKAFQATNAALQLAREIGDEKTIAGALNGLGLIHKRTGNFAAAIEMYEEGLAIARRVGDRRGERICLGNLAISYGKIRRLREMKQSAEKALLIAREIGDNIGAGNHLSTLGNAYVAMKDPERALRSYMEAIALFRAAGARRDEAMLLDNVASTLANQGKLDEALDWFRQAAELAVTTFAPNEKFMLALRHKTAAAEAAAARAGPRPRSKR